MLYSGCLSYMRYFRGTLFEKIGSLYQTHVFLFETGNEKMYSYKFLMQCNE